MFEFLEAAFHDVAAAVAGLLLVTEIDRTSTFLPAVRDLIVSLRDRRGNPTLPQPGPEAAIAGSGTPLTGYLTVETVDGLTGNNRLTLLNQISDELTHAEPGE
ncbi:hypothetical protein [Subtercola boreus]|uniref:hypothetical protein n=1 Tax=Subtercola boreus TaxID=120213 RepID=UPI00209C3658|nr:hypothetical protein [Subtercola boreus]